MRVSFGHPAIVRAAVRSGGVAEPADSSSSSLFPNKRGCIISASRKHVYAAPSSMPSPSTAPDNADEPRRKATKRPHTQGNTVWPPHPPGSVMPHPSPRTTDPASTTPPTPTPAPEVTHRLPTRLDSRQSQTRASVSRTDTAADPNDLQPLRRGHHRQRARTWRWPSAQRRGFQLPRGVTTFPNMPLRIIYQPPRISKRYAGFFTAIFKEDHMKKRFKCILGIMLVLMMCMSLMPVTALAEGTTDTSVISQTESVPDETSSAPSDDSSMSDDSGPVEPDPGDVVESAPPPASEEPVEPTPPAEEEPAESMPPISVPTPTPTAPITPVEPELVKVVDKPLVRVDYHYYADSPEQVIAEYAANTLASNHSYYAPGAYGGRKHHHCCQQVPRRCAGQHGRHAIPRAVERQRGHHCAGILRCGDQYGFTAAGLYGALHHSRMVLPRVGGCGASGKGNDLRF